MDSRGLFIREGSSSLSVSAADTETRAEVYTAVFTAAQNSVSPQLNHLGGCEDDTAVLSSHSAPHSTKCLKLQKILQSQQVPFIEIILAPTVIQL